MAASSHDKNALIYIGKVELPIQAAYNQDMNIFLEDSVIHLSYQEDRGFVSSYSIQKISYLNQCNVITKERLNKVLEVNLIPISPLKFCFAALSTDEQGHSFYRLDIYDSNHRVQSFNLHVNKQKLLEIHIDPNYPNFLIIISDKNLYIKDLEKTGIFHLSSEKFRFFYVGNGEVAYIDGFRPTDEWSFTKTVFTIDFVKHKLIKKSISKALLGYPFTEVIPDFKVSPKDPNIWLLVSDNWYIRIAVLSEGISMLLPANGLRMGKIYRVEWLIDGSIFVGCHEEKNYYIGRISEGQVNFSPIENVGRRVGSKIIKFTPVSSKVIAEIFTLKSVQDELKHSSEELKSELKSILPFSRPLIDIVAGYAGQFEKKSMLSWMNKNKEEKEFQEILNLYNSFYSQISQWGAASSRETKLDPQLVLKKETLGFLIENIKSSQSLEVGIQKLLHPDSPLELREKFIALIESNELPLVKKFMKQHHMRVKKSRP